MGQLFYPFLFLIARSTANDLQRQVEHLKAENEMLRTRDPKKRIFLRADERATIAIVADPAGGMYRFPGP